MGESMNESGHTNDRFRCLWNTRRVAALLALMLLAIWLLWPAVALAQEPTPRATPTPVTLLELMPQSGMPGAVVMMRGYGFMNLAQVNVMWDDDLLLENVSVRLDGSFETQFEVPSDTAGEHMLRVLIAGDPNPRGQAVFELILPTATPTLTLTPTATHTSTPIPTNTMPPTLMPSPTHTPYPTSTLLPTTTPTARPTLRPATPIRVAPTIAAVTPTSYYRAPAATSTPVYVTPSLPGTATVTPAVGSEASVTPTPATDEATATLPAPTTEPAETSAPTETTPIPTVQPATATSTSTISLAAVASATPTATITPLPADTHLADTGIGPFVMVLVGGVLLGAGALGLRHLRANVLT
jgi:hypothetical protein